MSGGEPVAVMHGANAPLLQKMIEKEIRRERQVLKGEACRETISLEDAVPGIYCWLFLTILATLWKILTKCGICCHFGYFLAFKKEIRLEGQVLKCKACRETISLEDAVPGIYCWLFLTISATLWKILTKCGI